MNSYIEHLDKQHTDRLTKGDETELRELIIHMWVHDGYERNGYNQMTEKQKQLFDAIVNEEED